MKIIDLLNEIAKNKIKLGTKFVWYHGVEEITLIFKERFAAPGLYFEEEEKELFEVYSYAILNEIVVEIKNNFENIEELSYKYVNTYGNISQHRKSEEPLIDKINLLIKNQNKIIEQLKKGNK